jgi:hypothetical protein
VRCYYKEGERVRDVKIEKEREIYVFRTMRSRDHDVVLVRRTINLGYCEFGMGRG